MKIYFQFLIFAAVGILVGVGFGVWKLQRKQAVSENLWRPNIVILSFCSLRKAELDGTLTPNLNKIFENAFVMKNAFSRYGWTNPSLYLFEAIQPRLFNSHDYDLIGAEAEGMLTRLPSDQVFVGPQTATANQYVHDYQMPLELLRTKMMEPRVKPFFAYVHVKYMHYPYIDKVNPDVHWDRFLSPTEKARVERLLRDFSSDESLPLKLVLTGDTKYLGRELKDRADYSSIYPLFSDAKVMAKWKAEPDYPQDLEIIRKIYRAKLSDWDKKFQPLFEFFGDEEMAKNTILIVTGDHGEAFMEHGTLGHANHVYDEVITFPMAVKFPGQRGQTVIENQFFQGTFVEMVRGIIEGKISQKNFTDKIVELPQNKMIISRNCANTIFSVRWDNRWKYVEESGVDPRLYDLHKDPGEYTDVIAANPEIAAKLKFHLIDHASEYSKVVDITPCRD